MPERLRVSPLESSVILLNEIFPRIPGGGMRGHYSEAVARALYGNVWKHWYHPENSPFRPEDFLQDSQRSQLLINEVARALDSIQPIEKMVLKLRFGGADGMLRRWGEIEEKFGISINYSKQLKTRAFKKFKHPSRRRPLKSLLPERS